MGIVTDPQEVKLFLKGIKPGFLKNRKSIEKLGIDTSKYFITEFRDSLILTHKETHINNLNDFYSVGVALGYYPKSCEEFVKANFRDYILNFNGIKFNTCGYYEEALEWCKEQYQDKILSEFGQLSYYRKYYNEDIRSWLVDEDSIVIIKGECYD